MKNLLEKEERRLRKRAERLAQEYRKCKVELRTARENEKKLLLKVAALEEELSNQGEIVETVVEKLVTI